MRLTVYKNQYGYSTLCKNKDQNGNEQKCYIGHIANEICRSVIEMYTQAGEDS